MTRSMAGPLRNNVGPVILYQDAEFPAFFFHFPLGLYHAGDDGTTVWIGDNKFVEVHVMWRIVRAVVSQPESSSRFQRIG